MELPFYHDLQCLSGFGDRILDVWAALAIANLHDPGAEVAVCWEKGNRFPGFVGTYSTDLFSVGNCVFVDAPIPGSASVVKKFSHTDLNEICMLRLVTGTHQIILRSGLTWGNSSPERLYNDIRFYGLDADILQSHITDVYHEVAKSTKASKCIIDAIPVDIEARVGIHIRLKDKLVKPEYEAAYDMSLSTWSQIEVRGIKLIEQSIAQGKPLFLCSDDSRYLAELVDYIQGKGGDVITAEPIAEHCHQSGYEALVDLFSLSRCAKIVQMTKYSTFSLAASMINNTPLLNLYHGKANADHRLDIWRSALPQLEC